jgi:hypothetical protein
MIMPTNKDGEGDVTAYFTHIRGVHRELNQLSVVHLFL